MPRDEIDGVRKSKPGVFPPQFRIEVIFKEAARAGGDSVSAASASAALSLAAGGIPMSV